jgi:hypothetical protein
VVRRQSITVERLIGRFAFSAHGLVSRRQLLRADVSEGQIRSRLASGALLVEYPGVYRVGHRAPSLESRYLAAVLACGDGARLSGPSGAFLLGLIKGPEPSPEVTTPTVRDIKGIATRRSCRDHRDETITYRGIPVTSPPRTLVDIAPELSADELARACHEAGVRYRTTPAQVEAVLARYPTAPGAAKLRAILHGDVRVTLSKLEGRFLVLLAEAGLELPETNRPAGGRRVDCRWVKQHLTVELDSYRYHNSRQSWERDRQREREARARGDEFRRYTWEDVFELPAPMLSDLCRLLNRDG